MQDADEQPPTRNATVSGMGVDELQRGYALLQAVADGTSDAVYVKDRHGRYLFANRSACEQVGQPVAEVVGHDDTHLLSADDAARVMARDAALLASGQTQTYEEQLTLGGELRTFSATKGLVRDPDGEVIGLFGISRDVTAERLVERELRQSEEQFRLIMANLADLVAVLDLDGRRLYNSPSYQGILGDPERLQGSSSFDEVHPEDRERVRAVFLETVRTGVGHRLEYRLVNKQGEARHIESQGSAIRDARGQVAQVVVVSRDVTERRLADARTEASERRYRELVENANSIILHWSRDGRLLFLNEFGQRFFGYTQQEIAGRHLVGTIVPETETTGRDMRPLMDQISADPAAFEQNVNENMRRGGERVRVAWTNKVVLDEHGQVAEILSIGADITARVRAEEALRAYQASLEQRVLARTAELAEARDRAEAADRTKSSFLASMSHELRTPLNSIIGFTGLLLQGLAGPLNDEQAKQLGMVKKSGQHLLALINDVLDISKIEAGQLQISLAPFDLRAAIETAIHAMEPLADQKHLRIEARIAPEIGLVTSDRRRVEQVLLNLLSNAIKFAEHGSVTLTAELAPDSDRTARIAVADTGLGIAPYDLPKLFQPFRQLDTGLTRRHDGTGLGLAICRRLVERLGGTITVESELGHGSTFFVALPLDAESSP